MKVQVEEVSPIERNLHIEVEPERVEEELARAYVALGRQVKIAGFRPGKVPRRILEQRFREQVEDDVVRRVVERAYLTAINENKVEAVSSPQVTPTQLKSGVPFTFQARVEVKPKLEPKDYQGIELKREDSAVGDEKVTERIEQMRSRMASLVPVEGRDVAEKGDYVLADYVGSADGTELPGGQQANFTVQVAPGELYEGNIAALEGAKVGEVREVDYTYPAEYEDANLKGKTAHFKITVKALKRQVTPELDDAFAKEIGGGDTMEAMRAKVRADLEAGAKVQTEQGERDALIKSLVEKNPFDVPRAMVDRAVEFMLDGALRNIARGGMDPRQLGLDFNRLRDELRPRGETEVRGSLILEAIALKENILPAPADVEARIETLAAESGPQAAQVRQHFGNPEERRGLSLRLREEKTIEFLKAHAKYS